MVYPFDQALYFRIFFELAISILDKVLSLEYLLVSETACFEKHLGNWV